MKSDNFFYLEDFTEKILTDHNLLTCPVDVDALVSALGIRKDETDLKIGLSGMAVVHGSTKIIAINRSQHEHRKRFTIGHELGHLYLDSGSPLSVDHNIYYRDGSSDKKELRANYFSAALLMPRKLIADYLEKYNPLHAFGDDEIQKMAECFNVSTQAMCIRLSTLKYL